MRALAISIVLALLVASPALAAEGKPPAKPPSALWGKYPLGEQKLQPLPKSNAPAAPSPRTPQSRQNPPAVSSGDTSGSSFPLWAVLLGALALSCVLGLAGESIVRRLKLLVRPPKGYETILAEEPEPRRPAEAARELPQAPLPARPDLNGASLAVSVSRLEDAVAALGYDDPRLRAVVEAVSVSGEWRPLALATVLSSWDMPATSVQLAPAPQAVSQFEGGMTMGDDGYAADLANRVAVVLHAAEEVAARIRDEAREEAAEIRRGAEDAAATRIEHLTQEAKELHAKAEKALAEAEAHARTRRDAAEETALRIEAEALKHQAELSEATRSLEERLQNTLAELEHVSSSAEEVLMPAAKPKSTRKKDGPSEALSA